MRSTPIFKILGLAVLAGILLYFGIQGYSYFSDTMRRSEVYESSMEETISLAGWVIRDEEVFSHSGGTLSHSQSEGARVGAGQALVVAYPDAEALNTVDRIKTLELQLEQLEFARSSFLDPDAVLKLDSTIESDLVALRQDLSDGDYNNLRADPAALKVAVMKRDHTYLSQDAIDEAINSAEAELSTLQGSLSGAVYITAERVGTYSANCDGYETVLTPDFLTDITPAKLNSLHPTSNDSNVGKLIYGDRWYYAAVISETDAQRLGKRQTVTLRFAKGLMIDVDMSVDALTKSENGQCVLVLSCDKYLAQTTLLRYQAAQIILHTYEGLRVNSNAVRVDEDGQSGVYCVIGATARFKPIEVVCEGDGFVLVTPAPSAYADPSGVTVLRVGDEAITSAGELHNGKVIS